MFDEVGEKLEEFGVLEVNYYILRRRLKNVVNKLNFFYCGLIKFFFCLNVI